VIQVERIGEDPPMALRAGTRPLSRIRVLDLTRVLAGPTCGRTLAEHGADVLRVTGPRLPDVEPFVIDTGHGKLSTLLDLDRGEDVKRLHELAAGADVFVGGYRSGALERRGFGPEALAAAAAGGIVYVSINCYGHLGPWRERAGWEQLAQSVTGLAHEHGGAGVPALVPAAACDYTTGYLAALGALVGLLRRAREGGSWHVRASLCQTGTWIQRHGSAALAPARGGVRGEPIVGEPKGFLAEEIAAFSSESITSYGPTRHLAPALGLSETPPRWERPSPPLGAHPAAWPD